MCNGDALDPYQNEGIIAEPAGALSVAGLLEADIEPGSTVVPDFGRQQRRVLLREVLERFRWSTWALPSFPGRTSCRARVRCAGFSTTCSDPTTISPCSSIKRNKSGRPVRRWWVSSRDRPRI